MQVKIISMQRVINYGSFLQAYALKKLIEQEGHQVTFCDFLPGIPRHQGQKVKKVTAIDKALNLRYLVLSPKRYIGYRVFRNRLKKSYAEYLSQYLNVQSQKQLNYDADLMVIGSDEVFNYTQNHAFGYVPALFGHGVSAAALVSYAASAGYASVDDVKRDHMEEEIGSGLSHFDLISVRDKNTYDMVSKLSAHTPAMVLDPTLVYDFSSEVVPRKLPYPYLLVYAYGERIEAKLDTQVIRNFAKKRGLRLVSIGFYNGWCDENLVVSPFELISIFINAAYVLTDTFHGTIFSIKTRKQFVSVLQQENKWGSNQGKLGFLLTQLGLEHRAIRQADELEPLIEAQVDYSTAAARIEELSSASKRFLHLAIQRAELKRNTMQA